MSNDFNNIIKELGFAQDYEDKCNFIMFHNLSFYKIKYEGYAYVLYKGVSIYNKPIMSFFNIYNKLKRSSKIKLYFEVPIMEFADANKLKQFMELLTENIDNKSKDEIKF